TVVGDDELGPAGRSRVDADVDASGSAPADCLVERLADDLEERGLGVLAQLVTVVDVEHDVDAATRRRPPGERVDGCREAELAERARLQVLAQLTELARRIPGEDERARQDLVGTIRLAVANGSDARAEHLRERREVLDGAVVEKLGEASPLLLLGHDR